MAIRFINRLMIFSGLAAASSAWTAVPPGHSEIAETDRNGCLQSQLASRLGGSRIREVCVEEAAEEWVLAFRKGDGLRVAFDRQPRGPSGLAAYLVTTGAGKQWLLVEFQDRTPASVWTLWDLTSGIRAMQGRSSDIPYIRDLDDDGRAELVVFDDLLITPTALWQDEAFGYPHIFRFGDTLEAMSMRDYPGVVRDFIMRAETAVDVFNSVCPDMSPEERASNADCVEVAGYAERATRVRDFAEVMLGGRPGVR